MDDTRHLSGEPLGDPDAAIQLSCVKHIRWMIGNVFVHERDIYIIGWALPFCISPSRYRFLLNGEPVQQVNWPLPSPDVERVLPLLASSGQARFHCAQPFDTLDEIFKDGFARFDWCAGEPNQRSYRHAWFLPDPREAAPLPTPGQIERVIGRADADLFELGGATLRCRLDSYLVERFDRPLSDFASILDWGCGCGRLTRHLTKLGSARVTGCDIDADNLAWCEANLAGARFSVVPLLPPTAFDDAEFDLVIGCSVFTHLDEAVQHAWLEELRRVTAPGGLVLASISGPSQLGLHGMDSANYSKVETEGFLDYGEDNILDGFVESGYYRGILISHDYIYSVWAKYFEIIDIVEGIAVNQDLVVMRRRQHSRPRR